MYRCAECEALFEEPIKATRESTVSYGLCPNCGTDDYEEVVRCDVCGEWISEGEFYEFSGTYFCDSCFKEMKSAIREDADFAVGRVITAAASEYGISEEDVQEIIMEED